MTMMAQSAYSISNSIYPPKLATVPEATLGELASFDMTIEKDDILPRSERAFLVLAIYLFSL